MTEQDHVKLAKAALAAINAHDVDAYLKNIDDSFVWESETLGAIHGRDGARQMMTTMFQTFPDLHCNRPWNLRVGRFWKAGVG